MLDSPTSTQRAAGPTTKYRPSLEKATARISRHLGKKSDTRLLEWAQHPLTKETPR